MVNTHQALSLFGMGLASIFLYRFSRFQSKKYSIEYLLTLLVLGNISSMLFGLFSNWFYNNSWSLGERFWGSLLIGTFSLPILLKNKPNFEHNYTITLLAVSFGMIFIKLGCALSHPACYGKVTNFPWGVLINGQYLHPIPIYDSVFQMLLFLTLFCFFIKKPSLKLGIIWLFGTCVFDFGLEYIKSYNKFVFGFSLPQVVYILIIMFNIPLTILTHNSKIQQNRAIR